MTSRVEKIIFAYLKSKEGRVVYSHSIDNSLPTFGHLTVKETYNPSTYSRVFRRMRAKGIPGVTLTEIRHGREKGWIVSLAKEEDAHA